MGFEPGQVPNALKPPFDQGFLVPYLITQVRRSGEKWPPESDLRASLHRASQQAGPENLRKPATQRGGLSVGERDAAWNWRRECDRIRTVADQRIPDAAWPKGLTHVVRSKPHGLPSRSRLTDRG